MGVRVVCDVGELPTDDVMPDTTTLRGEADDIRFRAALVNVTVIASCRNE